MISGVCMSLAITKNNTGPNLFFLCTEPFNSCDWAQQSLNKVMSTETALSSCFSMKTYYPRNNEAYTGRPWNIHLTIANASSQRITALPWHIKIYWQHKMAVLPNYSVFQHKVLTSSGNFIVSTVMCIIHIFTWTPWKPHTILNSTSS